jgi:hypothetical protein
VTTCAECTHWHRKHEKARMGWCRVDAPVCTSASQERGLWPTTDMDEGCGRFSARVLKRPMVPLEAKRGGKA